MIELIKKNYFVCVGIFLSIVLLVIFNEIFFDNKTFGSSDNLSPKAVGLALNEVMEKEGGYPHWQPWVFSGMPTAEAFTNISQLYFPEYLFKIFSVPGMFIQISHFLFCGIGMVLLLRYLGCSYWSSLLGSIGFMITPYMVTMLVFGHGSQIMTAAYIPWIVMFAIKLWNDPKILNIGILSLLLGFQLQRSHVQIAYYTWLLIGAFFFFKIINIAYKSKKLDSIVLRKLAFFAVACILGLAISFVIYLPSIEYSDFSIRGASSSGGAKYNYATSWSFHPKEILTFLLPSAFGFGGQAYWGYMPFTDYPNYMGIIVLLLALIATLQKKSFLQWYLIITSLLALLISFGKHFSFVYDIFYSFFPFFNKFRVPSMILILLQFNVSVLASFGLDNIIKSHQNKIPSYYWYFVGFFGIIFSSIVLFGDSLKSYVTDFLPPPMTQDARAGQFIQNLRWEMWENDLWIMLAFAISFLVLFWLYKNNKVSKVIFTITILFLSLADLFIVDRKIISPNKNSLRANQLMSNTAVDNFFSKDDVIDFLLNESQKNRIYPVGALFGETRFAAFGIESVGGYHPAKLKNYNELLEKTGNLASIPILRMMNVKYLISSQKINHPDLQFLNTLSFKQSRSLINVNIYMLRNHMPRAWFVNKVIQSDENDIWKKMLDLSFDPSNIAYVEDKIDNEISNNAKIESINFLNDEISIKAKSSGSSFLVLSEVFYPLRWKVKINGNESKTLKVNNVIRGVILNDGENNINFYYDKSSFNMGLIISIIAFIISFIFILYGKLIIRKK